ncbi:MAG: alpha/beta fold hydrolase [Eubacterium sp.]|nr:alpha/beta fold hydrolase [Eubacterium sp.]
MDKYFDINEEGLSVRCKLYADKPSLIKKAVIFGHGFGGHKDNRAAEKFAGKLISKHRDTAVITFDWPCHGQDARKTLTLEDCDTYLRLVIKHAGEELHAEELYGYATSFGGFLFLKYIADHGTPFVKTALRSPAVRMASVLVKILDSAEDYEKLLKGKPVLAGFDRKVKITLPFLKELEEADITKKEFFDYADSMLIMHGTKDEIVPFADSEKFAGDNVIEFIPVENADHRYIDPKKMDFAIAKILEFFADDD